MNVPLRLDAALFAPIPKRRSQGKERPSLKGPRLASLASRLKNSRTRWQRLRVDWYGQSTRWVQLLTSTAVWYHSGKTPVPIRWVLVRDHEGRFSNAGLAVPVWPLR